jgi:alkanesulfonate monooxygenase SsuD/methylene tetrahydromethanopterin reductase-like flavin-dependent oxidoreductase (luciferase family)
MLDHLAQAQAVGTPEEVAAAVEAFAARTGADEIIVAGATFDPAMRIRSLELTQAGLAENTRQARYVAG